MSSMRGKLFHMACYASRAILNCLRHKSHELDEKISKSNSNNCLEIHNLKLTAYENAFSDSFREK